MEIVERIEERYQTGEDEKQIIHPLARIRELAIDAGVDDLADRHDFYAHGKLED